MDKIKNILKITPIFLLILQEYYYVYHIHDPFSGAPNQYVGVNFLILM